MELNKRQIFEFVGMSAVVVSLLFLAYELRQSNRIAIGNASMEMTNISLELNHSLFENSEISELAVKLSENDQDLTPTESQMADALAYGYMNMWSAALRAYQNDLISQDSFENFMGGITAEMRRFPGLAPHFVNIKQFYDGFPLANSDMMNRILEQAGKYEK